MGYELRNFRIPINFRYHGESKDPTPCNPQTNKALIRSPLFESLQKYARPPRPYTPGIPTPTGPTPSRLPRHFGGVGNQQSDLEFGKVDG